ncbi:MAG TPA: histidine kinase [Acidimicrobiales bacterium]
MDGRTLRSWGGTFALGLAFPAGALVMAVLVFATEPLSLGLGLGLLATLVPWALVAGDVRVGPWVMLAVAVGVPAVLVVVEEAPGVTFLALLGVGWLAATGESRAAELIAVVVVVVALPVLIPFTTGESWSEEREALVYFGTGGLITWGFGTILRRERRLVAALQDARERLEAAAAAQERQRIAREIHDVVGHSLTVMLLNVGGARRVLAADPEAAGEALDRAERVGRESLQSVRSVVGLLRDPGETGTEAPRPGAADIPDLVATAREAGMAVRAEVAGDLAGVDPYAGLAAFRLVQEALSNVEHHAPDAEVAVRVERAGDRLAVAVRNGPPPAGAVPAGGSSGESSGTTSRPPSGAAPRSPGSPSAAPATGNGAAGGRRGTGLDGMRQRVAALGGTLAAGPDGDGWSVTATIPLRRDGVGAER